MTTRAEEAVAALITEGFFPDDAHAWTGAHVMEHHNDYLENRGLLHKLGALVSSEVGDVMNEVIADAEAGASILTMRAEDDATAQRVAETLRGFDAHDIVYYRPHTLEAL